MPRIVPSQVVELIEQQFPNTVTSPNANVLSDTAPKMAAVLQLIREIPPELIRLSGADYSRFVVGVSLVEYMVASWRGRGAATVPQKLNKVHALAVIRECLLKCPDEAPAPGTNDLLFIEDDALKVSIRQDLSRANSSLHNGEWKAAAVLAGSAAEALLLWAIQTKATPVEVEEARNQVPEPERPRKRPPEEWHLHDYIEVALELRLITLPTAKQARLGKDFRNLVHPGREQRLAQTCDRGAAMSTVAAVELIVRDLQRGTYLN